MALVVFLEAACQEVCGWISTASAALASCRNNWARWPIALRISYRMLESVG